MKYLVVVLAAVLASCGDKSDGSKIGIIVHFTKHGYFCKTWEGEIIKGGFGNGSGVIGSAMGFTVENEALVPQIQKAMDTQQEVILHYHEELVTFCRSDNKDKFVTSVEVAGKRAEQR
jgi:hypothetical protein